MTADLVMFVGDNTKFEYILRKFSLNMTVLLCLRSRADLKILYDIKAFRD